MANGTRGIIGLRWTKNEQKRDPMIDVFRTLYQKQHLKEDDLAALAGCATGTVKKMMNNETMRPQNLTFQKLAAAMHHEYVLQPMNGSGKIDYESEIVVAKEERKIYRMTMRKKRERAERRARVK
jgi:hypothetical protein